MRAQDYIVGLSLNIGTNTNIIDNQHVMMRWCCTCYPLLKSPQTRETKRP